jgi:hypothetical protein
MDWKGLRPYIAAGMTRFLLTLLALLSGLTLSGGSAEARICAVGGAEIGAASAQTDGERTARQALACRAPQAVRGERVRPYGSGAAPYPQVHVATVLIGPDRARE